MTGEDLLLEPSDGEKRLLCARGDGGRGISTIVFEEGRVGTSMKYDRHRNEFKVRPYRRHSSQTESNVSSYIFKRFKALLHSTVSIQLTIHTSLTRQFGFLLTLPMVNKSSPRILSQFSNRFRERNRRKSTTHYFLPVQDYPSPYLPLSLLCRCFSASALPISYSSE